MKELLSCSGMDIFLVVGKETHGWKEGRSVWFLMFSRVQ